MGVLIAGTVDLEQALVGLSGQRRIFHSEADFQLAFAWELQHRDPQMRVRLETRPEPGSHLDIACTRPDLSRFSAIEMKYLTRSWSGVDDGERYDLKNHGAQDIRGYDVVKDISRVERFVADRPGYDGAVIVLSNDRYYWRAHSTENDLTNAAAFRIGEGAVLSGVRAWGPKTGEGTRKNREADIPLEGTYKLQWQDYSAVGKDQASQVSTFRVLVIAIEESVRLI